MTLLTVLLTGSRACAETWDGGTMAGAKKLYLMKCSKCHRLYDPKEYDDESWSEWMEKMKKKARLDDDQYERISKYVGSLRKG